MSGGVRLGRIKKELERLKKDPPYGVSCWPKDGRIDCLEAKVRGASDTPYEGGIFKLEIRVPERYPFEPPQVQFVTKIYHPNIDSSGRICLDVLKSPPQGSWKPSQNISTILTSIQLLLSEPNPDDGLMAEISQEYKHNRPAFLRKAREWVELYAKTNHTGTAHQDDEPTSSNSKRTLSQESDNASHPAHVAEDESSSKVATRSLEVGTSHGENEQKFGVEGVLIGSSIRQEGGKISESRQNVVRKGLSRKRKGPVLGSSDDVIVKKSRDNE